MHSMIINKVVVFVSFVMALSNTGGSGGLGSFGHSAPRYCTVAGHYSRSSQPAALQKQCFWDLLGSFVKSCLLSEPGFTSGTFNRLYKPDLSG